MARRKGVSKAAIPFALATADAAQAVVCACHRDWVRSVYWLCAAGITASTVFIGE